MGWPSRNCGIEGCGRKHHIKGLCKMHHGRLGRHGDPLTADQRWKGGIRSHVMYGAWSQMINRCENPKNSSYGGYGAMGITVCDRWHDFRNFLTDMGERPEGKTLDRINPKGPYAPENCRWATAAEQRKNISPECDLKTRMATSAAVKQRWAKWRAAGNVAKRIRPPQYVPKF